MNFAHKRSHLFSNYAFRPHHGTVDGTQRRAVSKGKLTGSRVLIVEDEFIIALEIQSTLEEAGATVVGPALTLSAALEYVARENISAAMLDIRLGSDCAAPVAAALAERHIPFLFYTGQPAGDPVRRAWPQVKALSKPASSDEIVQAVADVIRTTH